MIAINQKMETHIGKREVIEYLKSEAELLREKLRDVEQAMFTLEKLFVKGDEETHTAELLETKTAEIIPLRKSGRDTIPTKYDTDGTYAKKVLYLLNKEDELSTTQLVKLVLAHEPDLQEKLVKLNVGKAATRLLEEGRVTVEKVGNANFYRLK